MEFITNNSIPFLANGSGIHIKEDNKGKFTETKKRTGKSTEELTHSKNPLTRKRAIFALNSKKWKHEEGGSVHKPYGHRAITDNGWISTKELKKKHPLFKDGGIVLPEITVTKDNNNYIDNTYDLYKFYPDARYLKYLNGGIIQKFQTAGAVLPPELAGMNYANAKAYWKALGDMDPRQKAGIMGNMYEESRMNPKALNANFIGLTLMSKKLLYPWVSLTYGKGANGELAYIKDYVSGKLNNNKYRGSYGYGSAKYINAHKGNYTPADSARLFQQYYERNGVRGAKTRLAAAEAIYKLFNIEPEPQLEVQPLSSILLEPIVKLPDATTTVKPIPFFKLY